MHGQETTSVSQGMDLRVLTAWPVPPHARVRGPEPGDGEAAPRSVLHSVGLRQRRPVPEPRAEPAPDARCPPGAKRPGRTHCCPATAPRRPQVPGPPCRSQTAAKTFPCSGAQSSVLCSALKASAGPAPRGDSGVPRGTDLIRPAFDRKWRGDLPGLGRGQEPGARGGTKGGARSQGPGRDQGRGQKPGGGTGGGHGPAIRFATAELQLRSAPS